MDSSEYQITIKSANQKVDDYVTTCYSAWTVHRLKQHIAETHSNKPRVEDQRLIYAGNLLRDSQTLRQVFLRDSLCTDLTNSSKSNFTIHLVCYTQPQKANNIPATVSAAPSSLRSSVSPVQTSPSSSASSLGLTRPSTSIPNGPESQQQNPSASNGSSPRCNNSNSDLDTQAQMIRDFMQSEQMQRQLATFQQLACSVAEQIALNISRANIRTNIGRVDAASSSNNNQVVNRTFELPGNLGRTLNFQFTSTVPSNHIHSSTSQILYASNRQQTQFVQTDNHENRAGVYGQNEVVNNENNANPALAQAQVGQQFGFGPQLHPQAPVVAQQAARADPDIPVIQNDVIDWVYYSIRALVFMIALYLHASIVRLSLILGFLVIAFFCSRRAARRAANVDPRQPDNGPAQNLVNDGQQRGANELQDLRARQINRNGQDEGDNPDDGPRNELLDEVAPERLPFIKLCYLVVTDFLTSLIPE